MTPRLSPSLVNLAGQALGHVLCQFAKGIAVTTGVLAALHVWGWLS